MLEKTEARVRRKARIRRKVSGTAERPRLSVYRSLTHIYAQVIDDVAGKTLVHVSTLSPELKSELKGDKKARAKQVGALVARKCLEAKVTQVVFDRNGVDYHGRVAAVAAGAREGGLKF